MQFLSAAPLVDKFRNNTFRPEEVGPYFMAHMIVMSLGYRSAYEFIIYFAFVGIAIGGVLFLKKQNGDTFANNFVSKYFCLGWVIGVRMLLLAIPVGLICFSLVDVTNFDSYLIELILILGGEIIFYLWLGWLFGECN